MESWTVGKLYIIVAFDKCGDAKRFIWKVSGASVSAISGCQLVPLQLMGKYTLSLFHSFHLFHLLGLESPEGHYTMG